MKNYIQAWRSSILSESNPLVLNEGLFDIGLPGEVAESINKNFEGVPEKGKTIIGNLFKNQMFRRMPRRYSSPLINDVKDLLNQIKHLSLNIITDKFPDAAGRTGSGALQKLPAETREEALQLWHNMEVVLTGSPAGMSGPHADSVFHWDVKLGDIQKVVKMANKAFEKGMIAKINGSPVKTDIFDTMASHIYEDYARAIGELTLNMQVWLKSQQDEYKKIPKIIKDSERFPLTSLYDYAKNWLEDNETEEQKIHTFDDTSYWYDLRTDHCEVEAVRMGHCGGDDRAATMFSLRYKKKDKQKSDSYITVAYNPDTRIIYQIKGKFNKAPEKKYYKHIAWLIKNLGDPEVVETGEHSNDIEGFVKMSEWLKENTDAEIANVIDSWDEMEKEINQILTIYNDTYLHSKIFAEMVERDVGDESSYHFKGYVGVPIELEELSEEGQQKLKDDEYTRDDIKAITQRMDDPRASGKLTGGGSYPVKIDGDYAIFFFDAADLVTSGASEGEWSYSAYSGDLQKFAKDVLEMDRETSVSGNRLQQDLVRALIATRFMDGGPFLNLYMGAREGELQEDSDWIVETDTDNDDNPKLVWFQTPQIYFDLKNLKQGSRYDIGDELEYYRKPQVVEKILNSNAFKETFMNEMSGRVLTTETQMPDMQVWEVVFENYNPPHFSIEAAWRVDKEDNESKAEVAELWLNGEFGKSDFEKMLHSAYNLVLEEAIGDDWLAPQASMDFPGGKRLPVNESVSHKSMIVKWKSFKGFS